MALTLSGGVALAAIQAEVGKPFEIRLQAEEQHGWWEAPAVATITPPNGGADYKLHAYWNGENNWVVRFSPTLAGEWRYSTESTDGGLNDRSGMIVAVPSVSGSNSAAAGAIRIASDGRTFEYADGAPCLLIADTLWGGNSLRCGLGEHKDGPFYEYLADRREKGFTAVLMRCIDGFGDEQRDPIGARNEGGRIFDNGDADQLNAAYFVALDERMQAIIDHGMVPMTPLTWWGKTKGNYCPIEFEGALRLAHYCATRYAAFNGVWALSGEYQYAFRDCGWSPAQFDAMGEAMALRNPYSKPISIHPSSRADFAGDHGRQSSRAYHASTWLDHHWLQTGQSPDAMRLILTRSAECRSLRPAKPVFCSEAYYERASDPDGAYHARLQAWAAVLNGCAGYGYGAFGVFQFYDPTMPAGETGRHVKGSVPWREAMQLPGSRMMGPLRRTLESIAWSQLTPATERVRVDGQAVAAADISAPMASAVHDETYLVYIPRGHDITKVDIAVEGRGTYLGTWWNPRSGESTDAGSLIPMNGRIRLPGRPKDVAEDWAMTLVSAEAQSDRVARSIHEGQVP